CKYFTGILWFKLNTWRDVMKCPNCNSEIFEGDKFCGECGYNLSNLDSVSAEVEPEGSESENNAQYARDGGGSDNQRGEQAKAYFTEMLGFTKKAILSPGKSIGTTYNY